MSLNDEHDELGDEIDGADDGDDEVRPPYEEKADELVDAFFRNDYPDSMQDKKKRDKITFLESLRKSDRMKEQHDFSLSELLRETKCNPISQRFADYMDEVSNKSLRGGILKEIANRYVEMMCRPNKQTLARKKIGSKTRDNVRQTASKMEVRRAQMEMTIKIFSHFGISDHIKRLANSGAPIPGYNPSDNTDEEPADAMDEIEEMSKSSRNDEEDE